MRVFLRALVVALLVVGAACSTAKQATTGQAIPISAHVAVRDLPESLADWYGAQGKDMPADAGPYFRPGAATTLLTVYDTGQGLVYVDPGGGEMAMAVECQALSAFKTRNGWQRASSCLH